MTEAHESTFRVQLEALAESSPLVASFLAGVECKPTTPEAAQAFYERAQSLVVDPEVGRSLQAARYLGCAFSWCQSLGLEDNQAQCLMLLGELLSNERGLSSSVEEPAEVKLFSFAVEYFRVSPDSSLSAMFRTNVATALVRTCGYNLEQLQHARALAEKSYGEKIGAAGDRPYSVFALGVIDARIAEIESDSRKLKFAIEKMRKSLRRLEGQVPTDSWVRALCDMGESEVQLLEMLGVELEQSILRSVNFSWDFSDSIEESKAPGLLRSNPRVLGLDETPNWLPGIVEIRRRASRESLARVNALLEDLVASLEYPVPFATRARVHRIVGRLEWLLDPNLESFERFAKSIADSVSLHDRRTHAIDGLHAWLEGAEILEKAMPVEVTRWVSEAVLQLFDEMPFDEKIHLATSLSVSVRQLAAFAARSDLWHYAHRLLIQVWESSSGGVWGDVSDENVARVLIFHDPFDTFVIIEDSAQSLTHSEGWRLELSGRDLAYGWLNVQDGATSAQFSGSTVLAREYYLRELERVRPLLDALSRVILPGSGLLLRLYGMFHHVPIASLLEAQYPRRYSFIVESSGLSSGRPSFAMANRGVVLSATPPELEELRHAGAEALAITSRPGWHRITNATPSDLESSLRTQDVVHIICHGEAGSVGLFNRLHLSGGPVSSQEILGWEDPLSARFVYLDACQSALDLGYVLWEAQSSIPGMLCRKGVPLTLGTTRKTNDLAAALFAVKFYGVWNGRLTVTDIYAAISEAQLWMRNVSVGELIAFNRDLEEPLDLPSGLVASPAEMVPFWHPACWAPYSLVTSEDACLLERGESEALPHASRGPSRSWAARVGKVWAMLNVRHGRE